jgi:hypothetical protein
MAREVERMKDCDDAERRTPVTATRRRNLEPDRSCLDKLSGRR